MSLILSLIVNAFEFLESDARVNDNLVLISEGGRLDEELSFHKRVLESVTYNHSRDDQAAEVVRENGLGGGYQVNNNLYAL